LFTIGAGSGGVRASRMSAAYGARVGVAEERYLGGTCVNVGCIPKKLFSYGSHYGQDFEDSAAYGWRVHDKDLDWPTLVSNKNSEIERLNEIYRTILKNNNVTIHEARATIKDNHTLDVGGTLVTADKILIATGGWPSIPEFPGNEHVITSNEAFYLDELPRRVLIVGGGYIAVEFAGIFHGYGSKVTQLYRGDLFLRGFDEDVRQHLGDQMRKQGVDLRFNTNIVSVEKTEGELVATLTDKSTIRADVILYATGRVPNTKNLGLEDAGIEVTEAGSVVVNETFQTSVPNIYAVGDIIDRFQLTPVAIAEAMVLSANLFDGKDYRMDYSDIATAVFSNPNIGTVGLTEAQARSKFGDVEIYRSTFRPLKHTLTGRDEQSLMKLIVDKGSDRVVGVHMVGADSGEIIQGFAVALKAGATKAQFDATVGIHPTAAEEFVTMRTPV
ncbi:MAG: glutathione-disulfide reductase, partial [Rhodospirillaceae bacterium]